MACGTPAGGGGKKDGTGFGTDGSTIEPPDGAGPGSDGAVGIDGGGTELPATCTPWTKTCVGNAWVACNYNGTAWSEPQPCQSGFVCFEGGCTKCPDGELFCQGKDVVQCGDGGTSATFQKTCEKGCYLAQCVECEVGNKECRSGAGGQGEVWECQGTAEGAGWSLVQTCQDGHDCQGGLCLNPCAEDIKLNTNQGCDYYAIDLENAEETGAGGTLSAANSQFAVIVSNPSDTKNLQVTIHESQMGEAVVTETVLPSQLAIIKLGPRNVSGTVKGGLAWRVKGNQPFVAYQFNPLDNVNPVYSNDASLLLPVNALGKEYMVMTGNGGGPFVTVVGFRSGTEVTITPSAATEAGGSIPALSAGESWTTTLGAAEVINVRAAETESGTENLTGTTISATENVVVFGGNVAANTADRCCADHLEQQMFPTSAWGTKYIATKSSVRAFEEDHWRVLALEDKTEVAFSGGVSNPVLLSTGKYYDVATTADFVITSTKPVLVGQFLASSYEILSEDEYCNTNQECASGACLGAGTFAGRCLDTCMGTQANCGQNETCLDNTLMADEAPPGGSCFPRICGAGKPGCAMGSSCTPAGETSYCLETCTFTCANPDMECNGSLCAPKACSSNAGCPGGWCSDPPAGDPSGSCWKSCTPISDCKNSKEVCIPPGFASDPTITSGICQPQGCAQDSDCAAGHTCIHHPQVPQGSCEPIGDPAFILAVAAEQFRNDYVFLAPNAYKEDYVNIIAPTDAFVTLDNQQISAAKFQKVEQSDFMVARVPLGDGVHKITSTKPVGIVVYGYHDDVSYGYPGGANLFDLGN